MMKKKKSTLNRLRGSVVDFKGPFDPIEEGSWEVLKPPNNGNENDVKPINKAANPRKKSRH